MSAGARFRAALQAERPLQIVGTLIANHALLAQQVGYRAIYLSGGGVAAGSLGMPDLGLNSLEDVLIDVRRITDVCDLPLLVDIDTGFGPSAFNIARTVKSLIKAGAAACHIEDQVGAKRCGHRPGKEIVGSAEMADRVKAAADAKTDREFFLIARTDAIANEGVDRAIERSIACVEAGADGIFPEAITSLEMYRAFKDAVKVPILANITEFGKGQLMSVERLADMGYRMVIFPQTAFRVANRAMGECLRDLKQKGTQTDWLDRMQTRQELYAILGYNPNSTRWPG